jgi:hypothetical protein
MAYYNQANFPGTKKKATGAYVQFPAAPDNNKPTE